MRENNMTVTINGVIIYDPQTQNPSTVIEPLLGDIIHCMLGPIFVIRFTNGGTQINQGDLITGATSNATARVMRVRLTSGAWALGNAAGTIKIRDRMNPRTSFGLCLEDFFCSIFAINITLNSCCSRIL